jgi:hypothetical protein
MARSGRFSGSGIDRSIDIPFASAVMVIEAVMKFRDVCRSAT